MNIQQVKQRFEIIGNSHLLDHALATAMRVAGTELSVLITGESGTGKENFPKIIHQLSSRKHAKYIAVNCGAIPEGTIDSELFGHEKGSFTGAHSTRSGYFEAANDGTIFLDEVAELPTQTQVRLLRVLETGEFMKVGSSKVQKTNVRIVAATNVNLQNAIEKGKFREDLFYRLSTVPIQLPPLRERRDDIHLLFRKFASDFAEKYRMPAVRLDEDAQIAIRKYPWPGNIRQLKNVTEQISVIEQERIITAEKLLTYLPNFQKTNLPAIYDSNATGDSPSDRELLYKVLFEMRKDITDLKKLVIEGIQKDGINVQNEENVQILKRIYSDVKSDNGKSSPLQLAENSTSKEQIEDRPQIIDPDDDQYNLHIEVEESLSLEDKEKELISKALTKYKGRRKQAANELGISERTLYRKIKEYDLK